MHATQYGIKARSLEFESWQMRLNKIIAANSYFTFSTPQPRNGDGQIVGITGYNDGESVSINLCRWNSIPSVQVLSVKVLPIDTTFTDRPSVRIAFTEQFIYLKSGCTVISSKCCKIICTFVFYYNSMCLRADSPWCIITDKPSLQS